MSSQSEFQGVKRALSLSMFSDDMWGVTTFIKVSGVFGKLFGIKLSGIRMVFVFRNLSKFTLFSPTFNKNLGKILLFEDYLHFLLLSRFELKKFL